MQIQNYLNIWKMGAATLIEKNGKKAWRLESLRVETNIHAVIQELDETVVER